jgi:eukaryotic-like serine/threonine-protein kinase
MVGQELGPYRVLEKIGEGGMGEVYRARDTRLQRDVAIKVLPDLFAADPDRLMRFEREAQALAALNHPNIAQIHGVEETGGKRALVMELAAGEDLAARVARGPLPVGEALAIARQVADALEAAHDAGIIHRDLKPANVKVREDGAVKVLDFGLAKTAGGVRAASGSGDLAASPTFTSPAVTELGIILGTAAYMAPEQARGKAIDRRADIWAFGCLLFEMLTGRRAFSGEDTSLILAAILKQDVDWTALPADTPPSIVRLLRRCLQKDPRQRLSAIGDARLEIDDAASAHSEFRAAAPVPVAAAGARLRAGLTWAAGGALLAAAVAAAVFAGRPAAPLTATVVRADISFPGAALRLADNRAFAIHPSGTEIVFAAAASAGEFSLYRRRLGSEQAEPIAGTSGAAGPFFSADGRWLGYVQGGRLKKMPAAGGGATDLAEAQGMQGGTFTPDGGIVYNASHGEGLVRIAASGGERAVVTTVDRETGEAGHHWPHVLPGGTHILYTTEIDGRPYESARIVLLSLATGERRVLVDGGTDGRYIPTGHIVYWSGGDLWAVPFDLSSLQVAGPAAAVVRGVMLSEANGHAHFSTSDDGTLVYLPGRDARQERRLMLVDRSGNAAPLVSDARAFDAVAVSPDGRQAVVTTIAANDSLWLVELDRRSLTRLTYEAENRRAVWSPDGMSIAFARHRGGEAPRLHRMPVDGTAPPALLRETERPEHPESWAGDLLVYARDEGSSLDVWVLGMEGEGTARPLLATAFHEVHPRVSRDGRWLAYASDESGQFEVYLVPFPGLGQKRLVSSGGGAAPRWRADGRELYFRRDDAMLAVEITPGPQLVVSTPRVLFTGDYVSDDRAPWDVLPDGQGFLMIKDLAEPRTMLKLVQHWFGEVARGPAARQ